MGRFVETPLGPGVVRNVVRRSGKVTHALVELEADREKPGEWPESHWRTIPIAEVTA